MLQGDFLGFCLPKAAFTSPFLIRAAGLPRSPRFCSSVPSPIIPGWETSACFLVSLGTVGLFVISNTPKRGSASLNSASRHLVPHAPRNERTGQHLTRLAAR